MIFEVKITQKRTDEVQVFKIIANDYLSAHSLIFELWGQYTRVWQVDYIVPEDKVVKFKVQIPNLN